MKEREQKRAEEGRWNHTFRSDPQGHLSVHTAHKPRGAWRKKRRVARQKCGSEESAA